jgi:hypothetical protein
MKRRHPEPRAFQRGEGSRANYFQTDRLQPVLDLAVPERYSYLLLIRARFRVVCLILAGRGDTIESSSVLSR